MRSLLKYGVLLVAAVVLLPVDGIAQGRGSGQGGSDQAQTRERAQVERGQTDRDRDRIRDQDRTRQTAMAPSYEGTTAQERSQAQQREQVQVQEQKQIQVPGSGKGPDSDIYGHELMSVQERNQYREQLRVVEADPEQKSRFLAEHREEMQIRANAQGSVISDGGEIEKAE